MVTCYSLLLGMKGKIFLNEKYLNLALFKLSTCFTKVFEKHLPNYFINQRKMFFTLRTLYYVK